jgi:UMF1 family MFS transporter
VSWRPTGRSVAAWATYDLANTVFALGVAGLYFPEWVVDINGYRDIDIAIAIDVAMLGVIWLAPWLGVRSDQAGTRRPFLIAATAIAVGATFFIGTAGVAGSLALFALALVGFHVGSFFYDALLVDVSTEANRGRISGIGVGVGYIGSFVAVITGRLLIDDYGHAVVFRALALLFLLFALPAFFFIRERPRPRHEGRPAGISETFRQLVQSWRRARRIEGMLAFLIGRFFYSDAINTLIAGFLTVFALEEIGFTRDELEVVLAAGIMASILGGFGGGRLTDMIGPRRTLHLALYGWMLAGGFGLLAAVQEAKSLGTTLVVMGGLSLGATWSADRAYMARITPPDRYAEFYGLYATVGRFATILGPLMWGLIVNIIGWGRFVAMAALLSFLVVGRIVLSRVNDQPRAWAQRAPADPLR